MKEAFEAAKKKWLKDPNVSGVFIAKKRKGGKWLEELCIQIHVKRKLPEDKLPKTVKIPKKIKGVQTDVLQANPRLSVTSKKRAAIQGGLSVGIEENEGAGTAGMIILAGSPLIPVGITAAHVVLVSGAETPTLGQYVIHPGMQDGGTLGRDRIGVPTTNLLGDNLDIAFFSVSYPYGLSMYNTAALPLSNMSPSINDVLTKVGRTTGTTTGKVSGSGSITPDYSDYGYEGTVSIDTFYIIPLDTDTSGDPLAAPGDSGSLWYYPDTFDAAGIHTAHDATELIAYASYFASPASPGVPVEYAYSYRGSANLVVQNMFESKGAMNLSGSGAAFVTRLTLVNQDTSEVEYPSIETIYGGAGIQFLGADEEPTPEGEITLPVWSDVPIVWNDYPNAWGDYGGTSGEGAVVIPTYVSSSSFTVPLDVTDDYPEGRKLKLIQGVAGEYDAVVAVVSATYAGGLTTVVVDPASVRSDIMQIKFAPVVPESVPVHYHPEIRDTFTQTSHGFVAGNAIYRTTGSVWALAKADALASSEAIGIVSSVSGSNFNVVFSGKITLSGLTPGASYYLSAATAGALTTEEPDPDVAVSKPLMIAVTSTVGLVVNMRGLEMQA